jgi:hypothetical protein
MTDIKYRDLTDEKKKLINELVMPETDALREFVESEFKNQGKLEELVKHREETLDRIYNLLNPVGKVTGLTTEQVKGLINHTNNGEWQAMDYEGSLENIDKDATQIKCLAVFDIDHANFHWTMQLVDDAGLHMAKKRLAFSKSLHPRLGASAERPEEGELVSKIAASKKKSKVKRNKSSKKKKKTSKKRKSKKSRKRR